MEPPRWKIITPSQFEHERRALDFIRAGLPDHDPYRAWANFEFQAPEGAIYEVDLLVLTKQGFWLVEIKSWLGRIAGDAGTWTRTHGGKTISEDNPVLLANRKAKALASLLKSQAATKKIRVPWLDAVVFLGGDDLQCDLSGPARNRVFLMDRKGSDTQRERKGILNVLLNRDGQGIDPDLRSTIDSKIARAISKAIDDAGIRPSQRERWSTRSRTGSAVARSTFSRHPWSIGGGGAAELKDAIEGAANDTLSAIAEIGVGIVTLEDEAYQVPDDFVARAGVPRQVTRQFIVGDTIRDWSVVGVEPALFPYDGPSLQPVEIPAIVRALWPFKTNLSNRLWFRKTQIERGLNWFEYGYISSDKLRSPLSIVFAEVATHNHFALIRGGSVFSQTAPVINLNDPNEANYLGVLGLLNSSTACFWFKQVCHNKGSTVDQHGARQRTDPFEDFYQHNSTRVGKFPVTQEKPLSLSRDMAVLGERFVENIDEVGSSVPATSTTIRMCQQRASSIRGQMVSLQEELDWECYSAYGLLKDEGGGGRMKLF